MSWRFVADWAKHRPATLKLADRLGRSRGRLAVLDRIRPPTKAARHPNLAGWEKHDLAAMWIGHATVLLRIGGMTILTDPVFSSRVGVGLGLVTAGPKRLVAPAITLRELPPIDLILISHAHFDHLDRPTLARLPKRIPIITAHHTGDLLRDLGFRKVRELDWDQQTRISPGVKISAHAVAHWGARTFHDRHRGFNSYLIEAGNRRVLYGGDTAYHQGFASLAPVDLAILGIGAYDPYIAAHATPEQAWHMAELCQARHILPMHHSTFRLSHEPAEEPMERLLMIAGDRADRIVIREVGGQWSEDAPADSDL
ncbi:MAG TPA: MBL fold metallo-hydrolase [Tepidisphaeraceae bacterium]|nr:MBL fold metallo-hydrolase [Tepidisphaeraceae bacterium]